LYPSYTKQQPYFLAFKMPPLAKSESYGQQLTGHDPMHLIATYDDPDEGQDPTILQRSLSRTLTRDDEEVSNSRSPNVYIDELNGSDTLGTGTKQAPFQSVYGALVARGENVSLFIKRRCVDTQTKYWVPAEEGTSVDLQRFRTIDRAAEAAAHQEQINKARSARRRVNEEKAAGNFKGKTESTSATKEAPTPEKKGGFGAKLKKMFS